MTKLEAIKAFGTARALAEAIGVTEQAISKWDADIPELRVFQIQAILAERAQ